jgi:hypothetical protein
MLQEAHHLVNAQPLLALVSVEDFPLLLRILCAASTLNTSHSSRIATDMLLNRDYVGYAATEVVKKLMEGELVEIKEKDLEAVITRVRQRMMEEITIEDKVNEEVRNILTQYQDEMRRTGVSYQEMFKKVKGQLARDRKLILR